MYTKKRVKIFYNPITDAAICLSGPEHFLSSATESGPDQVVSLLRPKNLGVGDESDANTLGFQSTLSDLATASLVPTRAARGRVTDERWTGF